MTRSATEQPDVAMDSSLAVPAGPAEPIEPTGPAMPTGPTDYPIGHPGQLEIHVAFNNDMWWVMPHELSDPILASWNSGFQQVSFVWDWAESRHGSFRPNGEDTTINRYIIDFDTMRQRNIDNDRIRIVKVVHVIRCTA